MGLFPQAFVDDLKGQSDILAIVGDVTPLRKLGASWKGLCPFHTEKTPSFHVQPDKGFFKCFGCGAGGDVLKFVELHYKLSFPEAVRMLATRAGVPVPETEGGPEERALAAEREALVKLHEEALLFFREQLDQPGGARARRELESRGLVAQTIATFRYGYAPGGGRETLHAYFAAKKVPRALQIKSGLVSDYEGRLVDRFRNRLMIPIARDSGSIVAFGGRALDDGPAAKYLNSPETPIYVKGRTLYGLDVTKSAIREKNYAVLVEGYFDLAQVWQAGVHPVVASCGTALTSAQAKTMKRFASKVVLSFDPDAAGQGAAARSSELLVTEGFQVNVALLPSGTDPDTFIRRHGGRAYVERLTGSETYLDFLMDRQAARFDLSKPDKRKQFLDTMLAVAATIPDAASRDQFADRLAHKARITEGVIRDEIRKAAAQKKTQSPVLAAPQSAVLLPAEQGLLWTLAHRPVEGLAALAQLESEDVLGLASAGILAVARGLAEMPPDVLPDLIRERLNEQERAWFERAAQAEAGAAPAPDCVATFKRRRMKRELAEIQEEIDGMQRGSANDDRALSSLWTRKKVLAQRLEELQES